MQQAAGTHRGGSRCGSEHRAAALARVPTWTHWLTVLALCVLGAVPGVARAAVLVAGDSHACTLGSAGSVRCWGYNGYGELGDGTTTTRRSAVMVNGLGAGSGVTALAAGGIHTCALKGDGAVLCWGRNGEGQLGDNSTTQRLQPTAVNGLAAGSDVIALTAGGYHTCALKSDGAVLCWGDNGAGQLGVSTTAGPLPQAVVVGGITAASLSVGTGHACAVRGDGVTMCWGDDSDGEYGSGVISPAMGPTPVPSLLDASGALSAGYALTCALGGTGQVSCAGWGAGGTVDGTAVNLIASAFPVDRSGGRSAVALHTGYNAPCAVSADNVVSCWGANFHFQLGRGGSSSAPTSWEYVPAPIAPLAYMP